MKNLVNFEFAPSDEFEPSKRTKYPWSCYTHKSKHNYSGVTVPGFFQTTHYPWQTIGFFLIFVLEGLATNWSYSEGATVEIIIGLIIIDVVLAIMSHLPHAKITLLENEYVYAQGVEKESVKKKIGALKLQKNFWYFLIMASAFGKFYFFFMVYLFFDSTALLVGVCYLLGGVLHVTCTGYFIFTTIFRFFITKDYNGYVNSGGRKNKFSEYRQAVQSSIAIKPVKSGRHRIIEEGGDYFFVTNGLLTDMELANMITDQDEEDQKMVVAKEGVRHQRKILDRSPGQQN